MYVTFKKFHEATVFENKIVDFYLHPCRTFRSSCLFIFIAVLLPILVLMASSNLIYCQTKQQTIIVFFIKDLDWWLKVRIRSKEIL